MDSSHRENIQLSVFQAANNDNGTNPNTGPAPNSVNTSGSGKNTYAVVASIIGIIIGGSLGYFISAGLVGIFIVVLCTVGGAIVGAAVGSYLGNYLHKVSSERHRENKNR